MSLGGGGDCASMAYRRAAPGGRCAFVTPLGTCTRVRCASDKGRARRTPPFRVASQVRRAAALRKEGNLRDAKDVLGSVSNAQRRHVSYVNELIRVTAALELQQRQRRRRRDSNHLISNAKQLWHLLWQLLKDCQVLPDTGTFNALFSALGVWQRVVKDDAALQVAKLGFELMNEFDVVADHYTMSILFSLCEKPEDVHYARLFERQAIARYGFVPNVISGCAMLNAYAKASSFSDVNRVISLLKAASVPFNERIYTVIISAFLKQGHHAQVLHHFALAIDSQHVKPSVFLFSGALTSCLRVRDSNNALRILQQMRQERVHPTQPILNLIFELAIRTADFRIGLGYLLEWAPQHGLVCDHRHYDRIISSWKRAQTRVDETVRAVYTLLDHVESASDVIPQTSTYNAAISTLISHGHFEQAQQIVFQRIPSRKLSPDGVTYNALIHCYGKAGKPGRAFQVIQTMKQNNIQPNQVTYNTIIEILLSFRMIDLVKSLLSEMKKDPRLEMDENVRCSQLKLYRIEKDVRSALRLHAFTQQIGKPLDSMAYGLLLTILFECGHREEAISLFGWLLWKTSTEARIYNVMIDNMALLDDNCETCVRLFNHMKWKGILPNTITYTIMIRTYSKAGLLDRAFRMLGEMQDVGLAMSDMYAWTVLMDGCRRFGQWQRAVELLRFMQTRNASGECSLVPRPSTACYNAALYAAGIGGRDWKQAVSIFESLVDDEVHRPDAVTFSAMASIILQNRRDVSEWHIVQRVYDSLEELATGDTARLGVVEQKRIEGSNRKLDAPERKKLLAKLGRLKTLIEKYKPAN